MKHLQRKGGFSLVELLTVIAIIAILAAIIFPVMGAVKARAKETQCMTNLHDISVGLGLYQQDNRKYPETLGGYVKTDARGNITPMERTRGDDGLYPEYVNSVKGFHCPLSNTNRTDSVVALPAGQQTYNYYAYDSYDVFYPNTVLPGNPASVGAAAVRYTLLWAADQGSVQNIAPYPPGTSDDADKLAYDYKRQLRFRNPPKDTVVTWCSYHRIGGGTKSMLPVLFLDGHADKIPAGDIEGVDGGSGSRWRTSPKL